MPFAILTSPLAMAALLVPGWGLAAVMLFVGGVPGEWARSALTVWTALAAVLVAGGAMSGGGAPLALVIALAGFAAVMTGGPWGLVVASGAAAGVLALPLAGPRWPVILLALPAALAAGRQLLGR